MYPELVEDPVYPDMYRVRWEDGKISDMVNKTRAKDAIRVFLERKGKIDRRMPRNRPEKAVGAFK